MHAAKFCSTTQRGPPHAGTVWASAPSGGHGLLTAGADVLVKHWAVAPLLSQSAHRSSLITHQGVVDTKHTAPVVSMVAFETTACSGGSQVDNIIVTGSEDCTVRLHKLVEGAEAVSLGVFTHHTDTVWAVCFDSTRQLVITGDGAGSIVAVRLTDSGVKAVPPFVGHEAGVRDLETRDDMLLSCSWDHTLVLWDIESRKRLRVVEEASAALLSSYGVFTICAQGCVVEVWAPGSLEFDAERCVVAKSAQVEDAVDGGGTASDTEAKGQEEESKGAGKGGGKLVVDTQGVDTEDGVRVRPPSARTSGDDDDGYESDEFVAEDAG